MASELKPISRPALLGACIFMTLPALIPFYYAMQAEAGTRWLLIATGFVVAISNALILVLIHRWITRHMQS